MTGVITVLIMAWLIAGTGVFLWTVKRDKDNATLLQRQQEHDAYREEQRQRMKANTAVFMKEIEQITKSRHPGSNRHQRRTVASRYRSQIKSS